MLAHALVLAPIALSLVSLVLGQTPQDAPVTQDNPQHVSYQAVLQHGLPIQGRITGVSRENGTGVEFNINFYDFPDASEGPFKYHIHVEPLPPNSTNCSLTLGHLTPYGVPDSPACDAGRPHLCQPGDLSGKHGPIATNSSYQITYTDLYLSTNPDSVSFFGNRSIVVHNAAGDRLNCANFVEMTDVQEGDPPAANTTTESGTEGTTPTVSPLNAGQAIKVGGSLLALVAAVGFVAI